MNLVLDVPVQAAGFQEEGSWRTPATQEQTLLKRRLAGPLDRGLVHDLRDARQFRPGMHRLKPGNVHGDPTGPDLDPAVVAVGGGCCRSDGGVLVVEPEFGVFEHGLLIALERQQVVGLGIEDHLRRLPLTLGRVAGDEAAVHVEQPRRAAGRNHGSPRPRWSFSGWRGTPNGYFR